MRSRPYLHIDHVPLFEKYWQDRGWKTEPNKGVYDVLRMRHPDVPEPIVIIYRKDKAKEHCTVQSRGYNMAVQFIRDKIV